MDTTGCGKDIAMSLRLTQQFNLFLRVGYGEDGGVLDGLEHDVHRVVIVTLQHHRIAGDDVVRDNEMDQRLLIVVAGSDGAADLLALEAPDLEIG